MNTGVSVEVKGVFIISLGHTNIRDLGKGFGGIPPQPGENQAGETRGEKLVHMVRG